jgi:hypothetical protein
MGHSSNGNIARPGAGYPNTSTPIAGCETRTARIEKHFLSGSPLSRVCWGTPRPLWLKPESPFRQPPPHLPVPSPDILPPVILRPLILRPLILPRALPCHLTERCRPIRRHRPTAPILQPHRPQPTHRRLRTVAIHRHLLTASMLRPFDQVRHRPAVLIQRTIRGSIGSQGPPLPIRRSHLQPCRPDLGNRYHLRLGSIPTPHRCPVTARRPMVQQPIPLAPFHRQRTPIAFHP